MAGDDELNGSDIYRLMNAEPSKTATLDAARDTAHDLSAGHDEIANDIKDLQTEINNYWEGESAEAAKRSFGPIIESSDLAAEHLNDNRQALESQSREFYATLRALDEMEGEEPSRSVGDWISPWQTDHEDAIGVWVKNNTHNIEKYSEYTGTSSSNEGKMPQAFPELDEGGKAAMQTSSAGPDIGPTQSAPQAGSPSGGGTGPGAGGGYAAPMAAGRRVSAPSGTRSGSGVGGSSVRPGSYAPPSTPTVPAGYTAPAASTGSRPVNDPAAAFGPLGTGRDTDDTRGRGVPGATGGGVGPGSRSGIGPGGRPLAGGAPGGPGSGQGLSGGRMSGVAPGGAAGAAGGPGAAGGAAAGRGGAGMMGPMGAGAGGRGEDQEHQRKYIQDSDEWFKPERDEDGDVMRDPTTGFVVLPAGGVIGE